MITNNAQKIYAESMIRFNGSYQRSGAHGGLLFL
jgi:hypothetical protein